MKIAFAMISLAAILIIYGPDTAFSQSKEVDELETTYITYIDKYIAATEAKINMLHNSKFENFRKQATLYCLKLEFLKARKKELTNNLVAYIVGLKPYKIQSFLDRIFFNEVRYKQNTADFYNCGECDRQISLKAFLS